MASALGALFPSSLLAVLLLLELTPRRSEYVDVYIHIYIYYIYEKHIIFSVPTFVQELYYLLQQIFLMAFIILS